MTIPERTIWDKPGDGGLGKGRPISEAVRGHLSTISQTPVFLAIILLTGTLCLGLGLVVQKQNSPSKDPLWIEQLPAALLPGSMSSTTWTVNGGMPEAAPMTKTPVDTVAKSSTEPVDQLPVQPAAAAAALNPSGVYVASKTGTKYYLPSCATAKRIKDSNKVWFDTKTAAEAKGYQPASNCKGL